MPESESSKDEEDPLRRRIRVRKRLKPSLWKRVKEFGQTSSRFLMLAMYTLIALFVLTYILVHLMKDSPPSE